ncbi:MAG: GNAT family N-acetyltransferase [Eubacterium sp.]
MIKIVENQQEIIFLWQEAFGDTKEDILFFLNNAENASCLGVYVGDELASMLFAVDCVCKGKKAIYVYAACTLKKYRSKGYMSQLLDFVKNSNEAVCLIPASKELDEYYRKRDFTMVVQLNDIAFNEIKEIEEYLFEGSTLDEPYARLYGG